MNVLYLTGNPNLGSTTRVLQGLLATPQAPGRAGDVRPAVALSADGPMARWLTERGVPHFVVPMAAPARTRPQAVVAALRLALWAWRHDVSLVHCNEHDIYPFGRLVARVLRLPVVCHVRFRIERGFAAWAFGGARCPDALMWTSRSQRDDCRAATDGVVPLRRQHLVHLALDPAPFAPDDDARTRLRRQWGACGNEVVIGSAAHFEPRKRIEDFIELVFRLRRRGLPVRGVYAGGAVPSFPEYAETIRGRHAAADLGDRLLALGMVKPIEPFYQAIDIFVSTSAMETFGNSVCEAMASRRAVAAYEGGSVAEVIGDAGEVVATGDLDGLENAVERLVVDPALRRSQAALGRRRVESEWSVQRCAVRLHAVYRSVLAARGRETGPGVLPVVGPTDGNPSMEPPTRPHLPVHQQADA